jgi:cbb3-type cytochrome c oxidase subunit III
LDSRDVLLVAAIVLVPIALMWAVFLARSGRPGAPARAKIGIPQAMRPGEPDEVLEGPRLERIQTWGLIATLATAVFIPAYWLPEVDRQEHFQERFQEEAEHRGMLIYSQAPELDEDADAVSFKEIEEAIQLGQNCAFCHGGNLAGGPVPTGYVDPLTGEEVEYNAPSLDDVFQRWDEEVIRFTIERGRPGTPMPAWGVEYGGPMNEQAVSDVIAYFKTFPGNNEPPELAADATGEEIFQARCAVCHGPNGEGKEGDSIWYQGMALWQGDAAALDESVHYQTIVNGRRFAFMPAFGEAPAQGVPIPTYPLTEEQIRAVMEYERSL